MSDTLARIEEQQREQKEMLSVLNSRPRGNSVSSAPEIPKQKKRKMNNFNEAEKEIENLADPLEKEFIKMIKYFEDLTKEDKKLKVHKLKEELSEKSESLHELIDLLLADNILNQRDKANPFSLEDTSLPPSVNANCSANECRALKDRVEIEQFYADFIGSR